MASRTVTACFFVIPTVSATDAMICDLVNAFAICVHHRYPQSRGGASSKRCKSGGKSRMRRRFRILDRVQHLLHGFRGYAIGDLRVELAGEEFVQGNPAAFDIDTLGPGTNDLQLAL